MHTLSADPLDILINHNHWATTQVIASCNGLSAEMLNRRFEIGLGSLHDTLVHTIGAMLRWADRIAERPIKPSIEAAWPAGLLPGHTPMLQDGKPHYSPAQMGHLLRLATHELQQVAALVRAGGAGNSGGLGAVFTTTFSDGSSHTLSKAGALVHVTTHGMHHRAQCINMLRHIGDAAVASHLPKSSVTEWQEAGEPSGH